MPATGVLTKANFVDKLPDATIGQLAIVLARILQAVGGEIDSPADIESLPCFRLNSRQEFRRFACKRV